MDHILSTRLPVPLLAIAPGLILALALWSPIAENSTAATQAPSCAVGAWVTEDLGALISAVGASQGLNFANVEGRASLTVAPDGSHETTLENISFQAIVMGFPVSGTLNGFLRGVFTDLGDGTVLDATTGGSFRVTVSILGQSLTQEQDIGPRDGVVATLSCDGDRMTVSTMTSSTNLTLVWIRTG